MSQAAKLLNRVPLDAGGTPIVAITSGKGGVGKSSVVANLAAVIAERGRRVLLVDADFGLANLAVLLGITPGPTLEDAVEGRAELADTVLDIRHGVSLVPGGSGVRRLGSLSKMATRSLLHGIQALAADYDLVLVDTGAGITPPVLTTLGWAQQVVVVLGDDPASFVDAYAVVKLVLQENPHKSVGVLVNHAHSEDHGRKLIENFSLVAERFLGRRPEALGVIPRDSRLSAAVRTQRLVAIDEPDAPSSIAIGEIARSIVACYRRPTALAPTTAAETAEPALATHG